MIVEQEKQTEKLFEITEIENTPFGIFSKDGEHNVVMKNQIVSDTSFETKEDAIAWVESKPWKLILVAGFIYNEGVREIKDLLTKLEEE